MVCAQYRMAIGAAAGPSTVSSCGRGCFVFHPAGLVSETYLFAPAITNGLSEVLLRRRSAKPHYVLQVLQPVLAYPGVCLSLFQHPLRVRIE